MVTRRHLMPVLMIASLWSLVSCQKEAATQPEQDAGPYLHQPPPGTTPQIFARGIVPPGLHTPPYFTPDGMEAYWKNMSNTLITTVKLVNGSWTSPRETSFSASLTNAADPSLSPDGTRLFFLSTGIVGNILTEKENIWFADRRNDGWSEPQPLDLIVNTWQLHWQVSVDRSSNLYFAAWDTTRPPAPYIYCSRFENGRYQKPTPLGGGVNASGSMHFSPFITPDGSYVIFDRSTIVNGIGENTHLRISFLGSSGTWTDSKPMFTSGQFYNNCRTAHVTADGKYLFFIASDGTNWQTYWVDAKIIDVLR